MDRRSLQDFSPLAICRYFFSRSAAASVVICWQWNATEPLHRFGRNRKPTQRHEPGGRRKDERQNRRERQTAKCVPPNALMHRTSHHSKNFHATCLAVSSSIECREVAGPAGSQNPINFQKYSLGGVYNILTGAPPPAPEEVSGFRRGNPSPPRNAPPTLMDTHFEMRPEAFGAVLRRKTVGCAQTAQTTRID